MSQAATKTQLQQIFELNMMYRGQEAITSPEGKVGDYIGGGDGTVSGKIKGTVKWDLYEEFTDNGCLTNFVGFIETEDGARIAFDARGHGKVTHPDEPNLWVMVYGVKFETDSEEYAWLNATLAVWEGTFDMESYQHNYRAYAQLASE